MTSTFLQSELASLIQDAKRKHSDVRTAAERSLSDLKAISITSETQLAADLLRKSQFIDPFVLACNSKHTKLALSGTTCLQRLVASKAIPRGRLGDVLDAFHEASNQGYEVQLKILQALPSLLQLYATELQGNPLSKLLSICGGLTTSKLAVVSSTAGATFQQLVTSVFGRVVSKSASNSHQDTPDDVAASDASKVFIDMCMVVKTEAPTFLQLQDISLSLALEVIESCLSSEDSRILDLSDCMSFCETHLIPGIATALENNNSYAIFGQCLRVSFLLTGSHLTSFTRSMSAIFDVILGWLDRGVPGAWRRTLCLEFMKDICADFDVLRCLYANFDCKDDQTHVVLDTMGALVRIAAEDPSLIGLGRQSTIPTNSNEGHTDTSTAMELADFDAVGSVMQASSNVTGISTKWSTPNTPFLEQADRKQVPEMPETYIYALVLGCVAAFSDGLSKYIMPLSVPSKPTAKSSATDENGEVVESTGRRNSLRGQKYQRLQNPLKRDDLPNLSDVRDCATMIENCWPAVLATCSTFLNSALDSHFYHILVRTVQKLAQVSGVMDLLTPRDALLTTLAKVSVPLNVSSLVSVLYGSKHAKRIFHDHEEDEDEDSAKSPIQSTPKPSIDLWRQNLNVRNLLCLRALLNLGIALGPTLSDTSWFIIIQTLQQVEALMSVSPTAKSAQGPLNSHPTAADGESQTNLSTEIVSVATASKRMFESTRTYTDTAFETFSNAVFSLVADLTSSTMAASGADSEQVSTKPLLSSMRAVQSQKTPHLGNGSVPSSTVLYVEVDFTLKSINDLSRINLHRFVSRRSKHFSWDLIVERLLQLVSNSEIEPALRLQAASIIDLISIETMRMLEKQQIDAADLDVMQQVCLYPLARQMNMFYTGHSGQQDALASEIEMHRRLLDAIEDIVSHSGETLRQGWGAVFQVLQLTVMQKKSSPAGLERKIPQQATREIMLRTLPSSFRTIQLVVSDFLRSIDAKSLWVLVRLLPLFAVQQYDLNISLTTATLFWTINGLLLERLQIIDTPNDLGLNKEAKLVSKDHEKAEDSSLWFANLMHLGESCSDARIDVRNGSIRVVLKIFEASGSQLTANMWNISIREALLSSLKLYSIRIDDNQEYLTSFAQLLAGVTALIVHYSDVIVNTATFSETWKELITICGTMLERKTAKGHVAVFTNARALVRALGSAQAGREDLLYQLLHLWLHHHPADLPPGDDSSSTEFAMHAELLQEIVECNSHALEGFASNKDNLKILVKQSIKKTLLSAIPGHYSDDTKKMTPEQVAVATNLGILARVMSDAKHEYSEFLQELIREVLASHASRKLRSPQLVSKARPQPKYIAFMFRCIELMEANIPKKPSTGSWIREIAAPSTLSVLSAIVVTKYTNVPVNEASPAWQKSSTVATELFEAVCFQRKVLDAADVKELCSTIPEIAAAILTAPALETRTPPPSDSLLTADETFDIQCFARFHGAVSPLLQQSITVSLTEDCRKYGLVLFYASLIAKPWFGDFPAGFDSNPLQYLEQIRPGSIRKPDFYPRSRIPYEALDALFGLLSRTDSIMNKTPPSAADKESNRLIVAKTAAPYVLLRIAHTIKTFIADQKLRRLNPPPRPVQKELNRLLRKTLELSCIDEAFAEILPSSVNDTDGKTHLKILYGIFLQLRQLWEHLPRIEVGAWQADEDGRGIEESLQEWSESVCGSWRLNHYS